MIVVGRGEQASPPTAPGTPTGRQALGGTLLSYLGTAGCPLSGCCKLPPSSSCQFECSALRLMTSPVVQFLHCKIENNSSHHLRGECNAHLVIISTW